MEFADISYIFLLIFIVFFENNIDRVVACNNSSSFKFLHYPYSKDIKHTFNKICQNSLTECVFRLDHLSSYHEVYLECSSSGYCDCSPLRNIADVTVWNLIWNENSLCTISEYGPCGDNNDLRIECQPGLLCMESRCRNPRKLHSSQQGLFCFDDIDCVKELECIVTGFEYQEIKTCEVRDLKSAFNQDDIANLQPSSNKPFATHTVQSKTVQPISSTSTSIAQKHKFKVHQEPRTIITPHANHESKIQEVSLDRRNLISQHEAEELVLSGRNSHHEDTQEPTKDPLTSWDYWYNKEKSYKKITSDFNSNEFEERSTSRLSKTKARKNSGVLNNKCYSSLTLLILSTFLLTFNFYFSI